MRTHPKLVHVCLPGDNSTSIAELIHNGRIVRANEALQDTGGRGRWELFGAYIIFDSDKPSR
jgi:hypothetical protein